MTSTVQMPTVVLFSCCACCVAPHTMPHADACGRHQRAEAAEAAKARRKRRTVETTEPV